MNEDIVKAFMAKLDTAGQYALEHGARSIQLDAVMTLIGAAAALLVALLVAFSALRAVDAENKKVSAPTYYDYDPGPLICCIVAIIVAVISFFVAVGCVSPMLEPQGYMIRTLF